MEAIEQAVQFGLSNAVLAAVLAIFTWGVSRFIRRPALTHALWILVLLKFVSPPLWQVELPASDQVVREGLVGVPASHLAHSTPDATFDAVVRRAPIGKKAPVWQSVRSRGGLATIARDRWQPIVFFLWASGSLLLLVRTFSHARRMRRFLRLTETAPRSLQELLARVADRAGLPRVPEIRVVRERISPMVLATGRRAIVLLPAELLEKLTESQRTTLLAHEVAHLRRRDHWVRRLEVAAAVLYWWHPAVWWARREIERAEEQCCDACVAEWFPEHVRDYGRVLVDTVDFLSEAKASRPLLASGFASERFLGNRLEAMMNRKFEPRLSRAGRMGVVIVALAALPVFAQTGESSREKEGKGRVETTTGVAQETEEGVEANTLGAEATKGETDIETRLAALERLVGELARELREGRDGEDAMRATDERDHHHLHRHVHGGTLLVRPGVKPLEDGALGPDRVHVSTRIIVDTSGSLEDIDGLRAQTPNDFAVLMADSRSVDLVVRVLRKNALCKVVAEPNIVGVDGRPMTFVTGPESRQFELNLVPHIIRGERVRLETRVSQHVDGRIRRLETAIELRPGETTLMRLPQGKKAKSNGDAFYITISAEVGEGAASTASGVSRGRSVSR